MLQAKLDILLRKQERIDGEIEQVMNLIRQGGVDKCWNCNNTREGTTDLVITDKIKQELDRCEQKSKCWSCQSTNPNSTSLTDCQLRNPNYPIKCELFICKT